MTALRLETAEEMARRMWHSPQRRRVSVEAIAARDEQIAEALATALDEVDPLTACRGLVAELRGESAEGSKPDPAACCICGRRGAPLVQEAFGRMMKCEDQRACFLRCRAKDKTAP